MDLAEGLLTDGYFHAPGYTEPDTRYGPGYPLIVALIYLLTNHSLAMLLLILAIAGAITSGLVYLIGKEIDLSEKLAAAAGMLFGVSPAVIWIPPSGMGGDIFFVLFLALALYYTLRLPTMRQWWYGAFLIGCTLGLATLVRPIGFYFAFVFIAATPFLTQKISWNKMTAAVVVLMLLGFYATITPWMIRNHVVSGHSSLASQFAHNPFYYNIPLYLASKNGTSQYDEIEKLMDTVGQHDNYKLINGFTYRNAEGHSYYDVLVTLEKQFLKENLLSYGIFHLYRMIPFFVGSGVNVMYATITNEVPNMPDTPFFPRAAENTASLFYSGNITAVFANLIYYWPATLERIVWAALFLLAFCAPLLTEGVRRRFAIFGVVMILVVAILASPIAQPRYRIPAEPFLWLGAALGASALYGRMRPILSKKSAGEPA
jgi:4-amino-4-deoxy-L-arabinose transferase-like glycosyltransferase